MRDPLWQNQFLSMTPALRMQQAAQYRKQSKEMTAHKPNEIMDVNADAVTTAMGHHHVKLLIHGHTHRPQVHHLKSGERVVLGDWRGHFDYLSWPQGQAWRIIRESI